MVVDGHGDGPEGRWQRYPEPDRGGYDREFARDADRDGRRYDDRASRYDDDYRVPEPRFGDPGAGGREDPLFGGAPPRSGESWAFDPPPRDAGLDPRIPGARDAVRDTGGFDGVRDTGSFPGGLVNPGPRDQPLRDVPREAPREAVPHDAGAHDAGEAVRPPRGPELPPEGIDQHMTQTIDRAALRRPQGPPQPGPTVYRSRRPGAIILLVLGSSVIELLLLFVLVHAMFADDFAAGGMLAALLGLVGIPLAALGLYAVVTGAPAVGGGPSSQAWFRAPTAYLPIGLVLLVAAALAAR